MIRSAFIASLLSLALGLMSMIGLLMALFSSGAAGAVMMAGSLPGTALSFVALTLSTYTLPERFLLRRSIMFLSLGLNCFPWVFLLATITSSGFGPGA